MSRFALVLLIVLSLAFGCVNCQNKSEMENKMNSMLQFVEEMAVQQEALAQQIASLSCLFLNYTVLDDARRAVTVQTDMNNYTCDDELVEGWYRFKIYSADAEMATECVEPQLSCSTIIPVWLDLGGEAMPAVGDEREAGACGHTAQGCCARPMHDVTVRNCGRFFIYRLKPTWTCPAGYCTRPVAPLQLSILSPLNSSSLFRKENLSNFT